jgi:hypothetical protein
LAVILLPIQIKALPFEQTPDGFINYANTLTFDEGAKTFEFFNPRRCGIYIERYSCYVDYKETSSLGERTCINAHVYYNANNGHLNWWQFAPPPECGNWEQVYVTSEPTPAPTPQENFLQQPATT